MSDKSTKTYIGDAVYVEFDGRVLILTTEDGLSISNEIVLEYEVYCALVAFATRHQRPVLDASYVPAQRQAIPDDTIADLIERAFIVRDRVGHTGLLGALRALQTTDGDIALAVEQLNKELATERGSDG